MKFGVFSVVDHYPSEIDRSTEQFYFELIEQCKAAEALGFDSFWIAEHHFHEYGAIPRPAVWMAAAAQVTKSIKLGSAVVILPFDHPLRVAEDYAMVDLLSRGRLVMGVGSGYLKHEFDGFNLSGEDKRERFDEALQILRAAWSGRRFSYTGKYNQVNDVALNVIPLQEPSPEIYIAVLRPEAAPHVGKMHLPIMTIPYATSQDAEELGLLAKSYKQAFIESGGAASEAVAQFALHTHCAPTQEQAMLEATPAVERYVRTRLYAKQRTLQYLQDHDLVAIGTPQRIEAVLRKYEAAGLDQFLAIVNFGGLPHAQVLQSMELLAHKVMPLFNTSHRLV